MSLELFHQRMKQILGDEYPLFKKSLSEDEHKGFYINTRKEGVVSHLDSKLIQPHEFIKNGYRYDFHQYQLGKHPYFDLGLYYIQDPAAMIVANVTDINRDDTVLDMCAAPGGKSCAIAMKLDHDGLLVANDISPLRAKILSSNIERMGITNTIVTNSDPLRFPENLNNYFDKIFLDAPCSGEGMFRKTEKAIDTWSLDKVHECAQIQKNLLDKAYTLLKKDGILIYSTCTYSLEENEDQVNYMIDQYGMELIEIPLQPGMSPGIDIPGTVRMYPHHYQGEGQFIAVLKKNSGETARTKPLKININKEEAQLVAKFYQENLNTKVPAHLVSSNKHIYAIAPHFPKIEGVKILRTGLYLGECKKNRFEPSMSLARTLAKSEVKRSLDFPNDSKEVKDYMSGLTLVASGNKGYGVIFVDGYPLSFYKESNMVKNLYPKGLRK